MPGESGSPVITTEQIPDIPLYLIPKTIAEQIKRKGESVFRIVVEKKFYNRYTITIETRDERDHRSNRDGPRPFGR